MKALIIHNLNSGYGNGAVYDFMRKFAEDGDSLTIRPFSGKTPFKDLLYDAKEYDFVVACGGDGTLAAVAYELRNSNIPILPFPAGTANLLAMNLLTPTEPHALSKLVDQANTMYFDLGEVECDGRFLGFNNMAGCGYDETIMRNADKHKRLLGTMAYFEAAAANPLPQVSEFTLNIDGKVVKTSGIGVLFANFSKITFDIVVSEYNRPHDGYLDVIVLKTKTAFELLPTLLAKAVDHSGMLAKKIGNLEIYHGREITVDAEPAMYLEFDGEATSIKTPFSVRCLPDAVRYIVSEECVQLYQCDE